MIGGFICLDEAQMDKLISMSISVLSFPDYLDQDTGPYSLGTYRLMSF